MREFVPYAVAIARVSREDASAFQPLGTGTLITRRGRSGILTAYHCLHACRPEVLIGPGGRDTVLLVLRGGRSMLVNCYEAVEHPLGLPKSEEFGPDLTFIELAPGARLESARAYGSFWSLDQDIEEIREAFACIGNLTASLGFPELKCETRIYENDIDRIAHHETAINSIKDGDIFWRGDWDYIESSVDYSGSSDLPLSFHGFSGGGIWSIQLQKQIDDKIRIKRWALIGVTFFQTPLEQCAREIRGHCVQSIYRTGWRAIGL